MNTGTHGKWRDLGFFVQDEVWTGDLSRFSSSRKKKMARARRYRELPRERWFGSCDRGRIRREREGEEAMRW
ncbi:hypothetical protein BHM03_00004211 [Ensete ventricosum]|nr:hypothetical protein BHM03_00004211 [Ensete ventricosum]